MSSEGPTILAEGSGNIEADLVFVHGLRGDPLDTWTKGNICWPKDLLKDDFSNVRIITWGYDSKVVNIRGSASQASLFSHAENLLEDISDLRRSGSAATRPLCFVCHSLGGLVVKQALIRSSEILNNGQNARLGSIYPNTKGVVFLGTPHRGSSKTSLAHIVSLAAKVSMKKPNDKLIEALEQDSQVLEQQRKSFGSISRPLKLICFAEEKPMAMGMIVPETSATIDGFNVVSSSIPSDHIDMCKFQSNTDIGYRRVRSQLHDLLEPEHPGGTNWAGWQLDEAFHSLAFPQMSEREDTIDDPYQDTFKWILPYSESASNTNNDRTAENGAIGSAKLLFFRQLRMIREGGESDEIEEQQIQRQNSLDKQKELAVKQFTGWLTSSNAPLFWVSGKAASGKSTLMKHLYQRSELKATLLKGYASHPRNLSIASFFFYDQGKSTLQKSREGLLRSLLHQLLRDKKYLWNDIFDSICQKVFQRSYQRSPNEESPEIRWSWSDLKKAFVVLESLISSSDLKIFLMIDGLDEFRLVDDFTDYLEYEDNEDSLQARRNLQAHREIAKFVLDLSACPGFKILLSSRPLQVFEDSFSPFPGFKLQELTLSDIRRFVEHRLAIHPRTVVLLETDVARTRAIVEEVTSKASGVFLWVKLVVNILIDCLDSGDDLDRLHAKIKEIPPALRGPNGLYAKMLAAILPENRAEGATLFGRVLLARGYLTVLSLSFSQESPAYALSSQTERITQEQYHKRIDEINRRLKSRCAGLLESVRNPHFSKASTENRAIIDEMPWNCRPHEAIDPVVTFVHRTAIEYLQGPWHSYDDMLATKLDHKIYEQLLVSCVLRAKFIGRTTHVWELFHVVNDAIKYAKNIEERTGSSPIHLLDELNNTVERIWEAGMSAGRPADYNGDPGYGPDLIQRRREKRVPEGPLQHISSIRGPLYALEDQNLGSFLALAAQGGLDSYVRYTVRKEGKARLKANGRPLLACLIVPRSGKSPLENYPLLEEEVFPWPSKSSLESMFSLGTSVNDACKGQTIWQAALKNPIMQRKRDLFGRVYVEESIEVWGNRTKSWAKTMSLLMDYGPDIVNKMSIDGGLPNTPLEYVLNQFGNITSISEASKEVQMFLLQLIRRSAECGVIPTSFKNVTDRDIAGLSVSMLRKLFKFDIPDEDSKKIGASLKSRKPPTDYHNSSNAIRRSFINPSTSAVYESATVSSGSIKSIPHAGRVMDQGKHKFRLFRLFRRSKHSTTSREQSNEQANNQSQAIRRAALADLSKDELVERLMKLEDGNQGDG